MITFCDSFQTYDASGAIADRYLFYKGVPIILNSGSIYGVSLTSAMSFLTPQSNHISYAYDVWIPNVTTYPFYISALKTIPQNNQTNISGSCILRINADSTLNIVTADAHLMNSNFSEASVGTWRSDPIINIGGLNRIGFYINLSNQRNNYIHINGRDYHLVNTPNLIPTSCYGVILGEPRGRAGMGYKNLIIKADTSSFEPVNPRQMIQALKPTSTISGGWLPSTGTNNECASGVGTDDYLSTYYPSLDRYGIQKGTGVVNKVIGDFQVNVVSSGVIGNNSGFLSSGNSQQFFPIVTSATSLYTHYHYASSPYGGRWTQSGIDELNLGVIHA